MAEEPISEIWMQAFRAGAGVDREEVIAAGVDEVLDSMEAVIAKLSTATSVKRRSLHLNLYPLFGRCRDIMMAALTDPMDQDRALLCHVFGGDCSRVTRARVLLEAVQKAPGGDTITEGDARLPQCLSACESIEMVLRDAGLGWQLQRAQQAQCQQLSQRTGIRLGDLGQGIGSQEPPEIYSGRSSASSAAYSDSRLPSKLEAASMKRPGGSGDLDGSGLSLSREEAKRARREAKRARKARQHDGTESAPARFSERLTFSTGLSGPLSVPCSAWRALALRADFLPIVKVVEGVTWYTIKVIERSHEWFVRKRYNDFKALHLQLKADAEYEGQRSTIMPLSSSVPNTPRRPVPRSEPPPLPEAGLFGIRHRLNICGFNRARFNKLQEYLNTLTLRAGSLDADHLLDRFLRQPISGEIRELTTSGDTGGTPNDRHYLFDDCTAVLTARSA
eukprot:TRINITY_DN30727_c0_g1_i1.p1 TRINITY_DN30727_c0_g1~~TRINITY_DN30727_c0_g1_i1.p1  ORF type:complete len:448 (+),score=77.06 TRINITY_DN30727_c0_g1_i1:148-1491(+)